MPLLKKRYIQPEIFGLPLGDTSIVYFSDGERFEPSFDETVRGCDVFIVQSTPPPSV